VKIFFFAKSRELTGCSEAFLSLPCSLSTKQLLDLIVEHYSSLAIIKSNLILSHNEEYVNIHEEGGAIRLQAGDEIAVIPPISGG